MAAFAGPDGRARAALRWEEPAGGFDLKKALAGVERASAKAVPGGKSAPEAASGFESPASVPGLKKALSGMKEFATFRWRSPDGEVGTGFVGACGKCGRASIVQVFERAAPGDGVAAEVLASFEDHAAGETFLWEAFDVAIEMPSEYKYSDHGYDPRGLVRLAVSCEDGLLSYFRWGLARSHVEAAGSLEGFFRKAFAKELARYRLRTESCTLDGCDALTFAPRAPGVLAGTLRQTLRLPPPRGLSGVIWFSERENRIYATALASRASDALERAVRAARRVRPAKEEAAP